MKQFDINMSKGAISNVDIIPPPSYSHGDIPFNYLYVPSTTTPRDKYILTAKATAKTQPSNNYSTKPANQQQLTPPPPQK